MSGRRPYWVPADEYEPLRVPCGRHFDAVQVHRVIGRALLARIVANGVIEDQAADAMLWLIPPGAVSGLPLAHILGKGQEIRVPPAVGHGTLRWAAPPMGDCVTPARAVSEALCSVAAELMLLGAAFIGSHVRPMTTDLCVRCKTLPTAPAVITGTGADGHPLSLTACQEHAEEVTLALRYAAEVAARGSS